MRALFNGPMDPVHPCRRMPTRHCPATYEGVCGDRPCARFESDDEKPWFAEIGGDMPVLPWRPTGDAPQTATINLSGYFDADDPPTYPEIVAPVTYHYPRPWWRKLLFLPAKKVELGTFRLTTEVGPDGEITMHGERA